MIVVGGTYEELVEWPRSRALMGSGMRAAATIALACKTSLYTCTDDRQEKEARIVAAGYGIDLRAARRSEPVSFGYYTPVSSPTIDGRMATCTTPIDAHGDAALVFGMIECRPRVAATRIVFDPQQPRDLLDLDLSNLEYGDLAICANEREVRQLGRRKNLELCAAHLLSKTGASVIVAKRGAVGALIATRRSRRYVGVHPTDRVCAVGTGDVFGAAFAYFWARRRLPPIEAAQLASARAAQWAGSGVIVEKLRVPRGRRKAALRHFQPRVYIAGPYFNLGQKWLVDLVRSTLHGVGAQTFSPFHDVGPGGDEVAMKDLRGVEQCDSMLALLDGTDGGTVFEAGWATKHSLPIVAFAERFDAETAKMMRGSGAELHDDLTTAIYRAVWRGMGARRLT